MTLKTQEKRNFTLMTLLGDLAQASITKYYRQDGLNNRCLFPIVLETGSPRSRCCHSHIVLSSQTSTFLLVLTWWCEETLVSLPLLIRTLIP